MMEKPEGKEPHGKEHGKVHVNRDDIVVSSD